MKATLLKVKSILWVISVLFLFQGCSVYKSTPVTFEEAAEKGHPVKIHTINNETIKYNRIDQKDGVYYGVKMTDRKEQLVPLKTNEINSVKIKNRTVSTAGNVAAGWTTLGLVLLLTGVLTAGMAVF